MVKIVESKSYELIEAGWKQPLKRLGLSLLSSEMTNESSHNLFLVALHKLLPEVHSQAMCEIICALSLFDREVTVDLRGVTIRDAHGHTFFVGGELVLKDVVFQQCIFENIVLENIGVEEIPKFKIKDSLVGDIYGIGGNDGLPKIFENVSVYRFENVSTASKIKSANLGTSQTLALAILHKIFFQPGAGRKESALYKGGFGRNGDAKLVDRILRLLLSEGVVSRTRGDDSYVYHANNHHRRRVINIKNQLDLSSDPLWKSLGEIA